MRYYLVALMDKDSYIYVENIQRSICKQYRLYKNLPTLHITMEVIGDPDIEKLSKVISDMLKPYKKFKAEINGAICFDAPYKSVNLKVEDKGYIIRLARNFNETLKLHGFDVREKIDNWDLHISLANTNYAIREWSNKEYSAACDSTKKEDNHKMITIEKIELWKPINSKKDMVVKSFPLREY